MIFCSSSPAVREVSTARESSTDEAEANEEEDNDDAEEELDASAEPSTSVDEEDPREVRGWMGWWVCAWARA